MSHYFLALLKLDILIVVFGPSKVYYYLRKLQTAEAPSGAIASKQHGNKPVLITSLDWKKHLSLEGATVRLIVVKTH